jgi:hypothetical protein
MEMYLNYAVRLHPALTAEILASKRGGMTTAEERRIAEVLFEVLGPIRLGEMFGQENLFEILGPQKYLELIGPEQFAKKLGSERLVELALNSPPNSVNS